MQYNHTIDLDMMRRQSVEIVTHQYDDAGRAVRIRVLADGEPATLPANADIRYSVSKPDGTFCTGACSTVTEDNKVYVVFTLTYQMLVLPGRETIDISIRADGASISTMTFINHIQRAAVQDGDVESSSEFDELQVALQRMDEIRELKEDAEQAVVDAQAVVAGIQSERDQIATNTTNIATNTRSIGTNANNIATNATNIATNAAGISDLDDEVAQLKEDIAVATNSESLDFIEGGFINTNVALGAVVDLTPRSNVIMSYAVFPCEPGKYVLINADSSSVSVRIWAFIDSDNKLLSVASQMIVANDLVIEVPENATKCILNIVTSTKGVCLYGALLSKRVLDAEDNIESLNNFKQALLKTYSNNLVLNGTIEERTYYRGATGEKQINNAFFSVVGIPISNVIKDYKPNQRIVTYTDYVPTGVEANASRAVTFWDENGEYISGDEPSSNVNKAKIGIIIPSNAKTMNLTFYYGSAGAPTKPEVYWAYDENVLIEYSYFNEQNRIDVSAIHGLDDDNHADFISARRPTICFILDGNYPRTQAIIDIAEAHGYRIGLAPKYYSSFNPSATFNNHYPISKFLEWQDNGHEILSHMSYDMPESTTIPDATCAEYIRESYLTSIDRGFRIKGAIGSSGDVAERLIPYVQRWYSYGSTLPNHSEYLGNDGYLKFSETDPIRLWRFSMQSSTLSRMKEVVDEAIENTGLVIFYGHALSSAEAESSGRILENPDLGDDPNVQGSTTNLSATDHFTEANFEALLTYIDGKVSEGACKVNTPYYAINDFYKIRKSDLN